MSTDPDQIRAQIAELLADVPDPAQEGSNFDELAESDIDTIAARLNSEINRALTDSSVRHGFQQQAQETVGGGVEQFSRQFREDYAKYARLVKDLRIS